MIKLAQLVSLLAALVFLGLHGIKTLKNMEKEAATVAVEALMDGYISNQGFNQKLIQGGRQKSGLKLNDNLQDM